MSKKMRSDDSHIGTGKDILDHNVPQFKSNTELLKELEKMMASTPADMDTDKIEQYIALLQERSPVMEDYNPNDAWKQLKEDHPVLFEDEGSNVSTIKSAKEKPCKSMHGHRIIKFARICEIATILVLGLVITASALGFNPVQSFLKWAQGVIQMYSNPSGIMELPSDNPSQYHSIKEALTENGIGESSYPTWVPNDFSLSEVKVRNSDEVIRYSSTYESARGELLIRVTQYLSGIDWATTGEKEEGGYTYTHNNKEYYIIENYELSEAIWNEGECVYTISGQVTENELKEMIDSIT